MFRLVVCSDGGDLLVFSFVVGCPVDRIAGTVPGCPEAGSQPHPLSCWQPPRSEFRTDRGRMPGWVPARTGVLSTRNSRSFCGCRRYVHPGLETRERRGVATVVRVGHDVAGAHPVRALHPRRRSGPSSAIEAGAAGLLPQLSFRSEGRCCGGMCSARKVPKLQRAGTACRC